MNKSSLIKKQLDSLANQEENQSCFDCGINKINLNRKKTCSLGIC